MEISQRRVKKFNTVFIIAIFISLAIMGAVLFDIGSLVRSKKAFPRQEIKILRILGEIKYSEGSVSRILQMNDKIVLGTDGVIGIPQGANLVVNYNDGSSERFDGPINIQTRFLKEKKAAGYLAEIRKNINNDIWSIAVVLGTSLFFLFWLILSFRQNHSIHPAFIFTAASLVLFFMIAFSLGGMRQAQVYPFFTLLALLIYPVMFFGSFLFFNKNEDLPEIEEMDDLMADLLYDGLLLFEKQHYEDALKKFIKANELSPDRSDVKNLIKIVQLKINDPDKLDNLVNLELRMRSFFKKGFMERIRKKRDSLGSSLEE